MLLWRIVKYREKEFIHCHPSLETHVRLYMQRFLVATKCNEVNTENSTSKLHLTDTWKTISKLILGNRHHSWEKVTME